MSSGRWGFSPHSTESMFRWNSSSFSSLFATNLKKREASFLSPGDSILLCFWFISTLQSLICWCRVVLHSSRINIMLVKSKNYFVDLSLTLPQFLAPNFLITRTRVPLLKDRSWNWKVQLQQEESQWVLHKTRPQWKPCKKNRCISSSPIVFGGTRWSFDFDYISPGRCVWNSSLKHSGSSPNPLKAACWSHFLLWLDLIWGYRLFQARTKSRQISSD